jgi:hypothetical protein
LHDDERGYAPLTHRTSRNERALADYDKLGHAGKAPERHVILDPNVPRELDRIGQGATGSQEDIVPDVRAHHEEVVIADTRRPRLGTAMNRCVFPEDVAVADHKV